MSSYKLIQYLKEYIYSKGIPNPIEIKLHTTYNYLHKLGFKYKDIKKNVFIDRHKRPNIVQDCENFLKVIKKLEPYFVGFNKDETIKDKEYLHDYIIENANRRLVIIITHDKSIISTNNNIQKAWIKRDNKSPNLLSY